MIDDTIRSDALRLVQIATNTVGYVNSRDVDRVAEFLQLRYGKKPKLPALPPLSASMLTKLPSLPPLPAPVAPKLPPLPR